MMNIFYIVNGTTRMYQKDAPASELLSDLSLPPEVEFHLVDDSDLPELGSNAWYFFDAWECINGKLIPNLAKSKIIAHNNRRQMREIEFAPLDAKIAKQIPGIDISQIESERQSIRDRYAAMQIEINNAQNIDDLKIALEI